MEGHFSQLYNTTKPTYKEYEQFLFIDGRDFFDNPSLVDPLELQVQFSNGYMGSNGSNGYKKNVLEIPPYTNIKCVELRGISFPKMENEMYFVLDIPEFSGRLHSSDNKGSHETFASIYYDSSSLLKGDVKPLRGNDFDTKEYIFNPIEKRLNKFTIRFLKYGGNIATFSDIYTGTPVDFSNEYNKTLSNITLLFKFTLLQ